MSSRKSFEELVRFDNLLKRPHIRYLAGVDEAGRGAVAGPVVAAAVICEPHDELSRVRDSKLLSEPVREDLFEIIRRRSCSLGVGIVEADEIDRSNILAATLSAMGSAIDALDPKPCYVIIDGIHMPDIGLPAEPVKGGDRKSFSIAAASIVAKVTRDRIMREMADRFPFYGFSKNKGYGTGKHIEAIRTRGYTTLHRRSFKIRSLV
ncbi:MAG: ribonuclease HII [Candidatus Krumholzibacteria bacterium]|nr:ribonuclease HII [Candidatus Krumholzibacteria bacterium]